MTDTPILPSTVPPPTKADQVKGLLGDLARPLVMIMVGGAEAWSIFVGKDAGVVTAGGVVLAALWAAKTLEVQQAGKQDAQVKIAQAATPAAAP
ncbi:MAG TPA: hypothetical protein VL358_04505 [Caulobacteraceae bacterium]|jgi:hypothetical protein|nr:hypothetical protein [Caulobacteraceae bacterium]